MKSLLEQDLTNDEVRFVAAALKTRNALKRGEIKARDFKMDTFQSQYCLTDGHTCGTSHCIGGWIDFYLDPSLLFHSDPTYGSLNLSETFKKAARKLFYPSEYKMENSKREHGVQAIDNFLAGKANPWNGVEV